MTDIVRTSTDDPEMLSPEDDAYSGELTAAEARQIFDEAARYYMGISGDEFLRRWDAGEWRDDPDHYPVMRLVMLLPFAGR